MPVKGAAHLCLFYIYDNYNNAPKTGDSPTVVVYPSTAGSASMPVTGLSTSEVDATNAPGVYQVAISAANNDFDTVTVAIKPSSSYTEAQPVTWYNTISAEADVTAINGGTTSLGNLDDFFDGTGYGIQPASAATVTTADITQINGSTDGVKELGLAANTIVSAACTTGSTTSQVNGTGSLSTTANFYLGRTLIFTDGTLASQAREITAYSAAKEFTVEPAFTSAAGDGDGFVVV